MTPLGNDVLDPDRRVGRPVSLRPAHALAALLLEHANLRTTRLAVADADDLDVGDIGRAGEDLAAVLFDHEHLIDRDFVAAIGIDPVNSDEVPRCDLDLAASALNDCEHGTTPVPVAL